MSPVPEHLKIDLEEIPYDPAADRKAWKRWFLHMRAPRTWRTVIKQDPTWGEVYTNVPRRPQWFWEAVRWVWLKLHGTT